MILSVVMIWIHCGSVNRNDKIIRKSKNNKNRIREGALLNDTTKDKTIVDWVLSG